MENILQRFSCISLFKPPLLDRVVEDSVNRVLDTFKVDLINRLYVKN